MTNEFWLSKIFKINDQLNELQQPDIESLNVGEYYHKYLKGNVKKSIKSKNEIW